MIEKRHIRIGSWQVVSRYNRVWLAVLIWMVISGVVIFSVHAVVAASWTQHSDTEVLVKDVKEVAIARDNEQAIPLNNITGDGLVIPEGAMSPHTTLARSGEKGSSSVLNNIGAEPPSHQRDSFTAPPMETVFLEVASGSQERNLNCEYQSAADLAAYHGWDITWRDIFIVSGLDIGGDPNRGFVGKSIDDLPGGTFPNGYGVYAEPVARGLRRLGIQAVAYREKDIDWLKSRVSAGYPVVVWATYGMVVRPVVQWQTDDGTTVKGVSYQHTFTVIGYDANSVWVNDPYDGTRQRYSWQVFDAAWALLDRMALTIDEALVK